MTEDAGELQDVLSQLAGYTTAHSESREAKREDAPRPTAASIARYVEENVSVEDRDATDADPYHGEGAPEQKVKRTRRTKEQMAADAAAELRAALNEEGSGAAPAKDEFQEQVRQSVAETEVTLAQVRAAASDYMKPPRSALQLQKLLLDTCGVPNLGALTTDQYGKVLAAMEAA